MLPTYFISHGGGPWPYMKSTVGATYDKLEASLREMPLQLGGAIPRAVLMISGHWEEREFAVQSNARPSMIYDYGGFPDHTYHVHYAAPGAPGLAAQVVQLLTGAGLKAHLDPERGYDHGTFVPMAVMYPEATMPLVQLSMQKGYDPETHIRVGRALRPLRDEGVLIAGSGLTYHNLRAFGAVAKKPSAEFDAWLRDALAAPDREARLIKWTEAPSARVAHPREDHLIPLMVAVGAAADEPVQRVYHEDDFFGGITVSSYRFGG